MTMTMTPGKPYFRFITYQGAVGGNWVVATSDDQLVVFTGPQPVFNETLEAIQNYPDMKGLVAESPDAFLTRLGVAPRDADEDAFWLARADAARKEGFAADPEPQP